MWVTDVYLIKTDERGNELWSQTIGGYIVLGWTFPSVGIGGNTDVYLIRFDTEGLDVQDYNQNIPGSFVFYPPCPNPFNASTTISFELGTAGNVSLDIFDITGRSVGAQNFVPNNQYLPAGSHSVVFDGEGLTSGVYFVKLNIGEFKQTRKIILLK